MAVLPQLEEATERISEQQSAALRRTPEGIIELAVELDGKESALYLTDAQLAAISRLIPRILPTERQK